MSVNVPAACPVTPAAAQAAADEQAAIRRGPRPSGNKWNETTQGVSLNDAWEQVRYCYQHALPAHNAALKALSTRPIGG